MLTRPSRAPRVRDIRVDASGIAARSRAEVILDVAFDGRRVFSFWLHRDAAASGNGHLMAWPRTLRPFLDGRARVTVTVHGSTAAPLFDGEVALGRGTGRIRIETDDGRAITLDKSFRRAQTFDSRTPAEVEPLMRAIDEVLDILREEGVAAFLAYGTLLGAVRDGRLIGHDSDADLGYVSSHEHPADVARESFRLQRAVVARGHRVTRYSTAAFKVDIREPDGTVRGLDVFGGFMREGRLHLMGEIITDFERSWIVPLGTTALEGHTFAAPADTDRFLAATYGPSWRRPDPAFKFTTPQSTHRRFNGWFRGIRVGRALWDRRYARRPAPEAQPSGLATWVAEREPRPRQVVDLGCGSGGDVLWFARQGVPAVGADMVRKGFERAAALAEAEALPATFHELNLLELRSSLSLAGLLAVDGQERVVVARHLVDALGTRGRHELWRTCELLLAHGGRLYLEFLARSGDDDFGRRHRVRARRAGLVARELEARGATIVEREIVRHRSRGNRDGREARICRMVVSWER